MANVVNKKELVGTIAAEMGSTKKAAAEALEAVVGAVKSHLVAGDNVSIVGFANFTQKVVPAHERTMSLTGTPETIQVPERVQFKAKMSKSLAK